MRTNRPTGMFAFLLVAIGQFISIFGTTMTQFALTIWAWQITGQATALALVAFANMTPLILLSPIAGALVDRWNRKLVMMLSDIAALLSTTVIFLLYANHNLQIWHLYVAGAFTGAFQAFQWPAYSASISLMVPKEQYGRANALIGLAESAPNILAPATAGVLIATIGISGILVIDIVTFLAILGALLIVFVPQPAATEAGAEGRGSLWKESIFGFRYIFQRRSLLGLQLIFFSGNLLSTIAFTLMAPMILSRTGNSASVLGNVQSAAGVGGVLGGVVMSAWGGPKRRVHGVLLGWLVSSLFGTLILGVGQTAVIWAIGSFIGSFLVPIVNGSNQAIWQAKVAPDVQGRVFAARRMIAWVTIPVATLIAGPLADKVLEPAMQPGGSLSGVFGWLVGVGPGAGMGLIFVVCGALAAIVGVSGYLFPAIRNAEDILPDHAAQVAEEPAADEVAEVAAVS